MLNESHHYFSRAADVLGITDTMRKILLAPQRVVRVELVTEADDGELLHNFDEIIGPNLDIRRPT